MENITIYNKDGIMVGTGFKCRWAQYKELRQSSTRYDCFITGYLWPNEPLTEPGPYVVHLKFMIPDLERYANHYLVGVTLNYNDIINGGIAFSARVLSLVPPIQLSEAIPLGKSPARRQDGQREKLNNSRAGTKKKAGQKKHSN